MRRRFVQINGELVEYGQHLPERVSADIMPDIAPYKSMIDGSEITSRSQHRDHLRAHGCYEVGNEAALHFKAYENLSNPAPQQRKELIRAQVDAMTHEQFRRAIKNDADRIKWNTRDR